MRRLVILADDPMVVRSMRIALRHAADCRVAATLDGRYSVRTRLCELRPDVVVIDEMCQRTNCFARVREAGEAAPDATLVVVSAAMKPALVQDALAAGAHAVVSRGQHPHAIGTVLRGLVEGTCYARPPQRALSVQ